MPLLHSDREQALQSRYPGHGVAVVADQESPEVSNWSNLQLGPGLQRLVAKGGGWQNDADGELSGSVGLRHSLPILAWAKKVALTDFCRSAALG